MSSLTSPPAPAVPGGMPAAWLRDNCPCPECRDPVSGQRRLDIASLPDGLGVAAVAAHDGQVEVQFTPDGHRSVFDRGWLERCARGPDPRHGDDPRTEDAKRLWPRSAPDGAPAPASWPRYRADPAYRRACQQAILRDGLLLLAGVPDEPGTVLEVAASLGYVRETNYGRLFDVRAEPSAAKAAYTRLPIAPHTDNPYRDPVPTVLLLHCLHSSAGGGESAFTDGFAVAAALREQNPAAFATLATTPVTFGYRGRGTWLRATRPVITLDPPGRIREIRFNSRALQPVRLRPAQAAAFYAAYRAFAGLLASPAWTRAARLAPGDCAVFDNTRVLHARAGFASDGRRHLQGCYADLDGVESAVAAAGGWPDSPGTAEGWT
jgi:gamma-butyrobetaine dioxygenase